MSQSLPAAVVVVEAARIMGYIAGVSAHSNEEEDCGDLDELHNCATAKVNGVNLERL